MNNLKIIKYIFELNSDKREEVTLKLSKDSYSLCEIENSNPPDWTKLDYRKCRVCSLDSNKHPFCPTAKNIFPLILKFGKFISYSKVNLKIETLERTFSKNVTMQDGLSSLFGIIMTTSGCPVLDKLRPMVFTHLPFATAEETTYRVLSMYLLGQYYRNKKGLEPDWNFEGLLKIYEDISHVNSNFVERLRGSGSIADAHLNAIVKLNCFNFYVMSTVEEDMVKELSQLYTSYF